MTGKELEDRLISFAVSAISVSKSLTYGQVSNHLGSQLSRSGTSPALNYAEALAAESKKDFTHKMKLCLKELRESLVCMKIIRRAALAKNEANINSIMNENSELIAIFIASINTIESRNS